MDNVAIAPASALDTQATANLMTGAYASVGVVINDIRVRVQNGDRGVFGEAFLRIAALMAIIETESTRISHGNESWRERFEKTRLGIAELELVAER